MPKNSAKPQQAAPQRPPEPPRRSPSTLVLIAVAAIAVIGVAAYYYGRAQPSAPSVAEQPAQTAPAPAPESPAVQPATGPLQLPPPGDEVPASAKFGPHKQASYPPLPETGFPPPRPMETVQAVYQFAAEHPEVLAYIPCYCGCDRQGHKGNDDCFIAQRDAKGDVREWDSHGMT